LTARFLNEPNTPKHGFVVGICSPQANPGYKVLLQGKIKYFPPHLIEIVSRGSTVK
jgi:hypothetical protein